MKITSETERILRKLLTEQSLGALATSVQESPYVNLVAFAVSEDLRRIVFSTPRATRKFENLSTNHRAAMLVDSRSNSISDFHHAAAVTAIGPTDEITGAAYTKSRDLYVSRHPHLADFVDSPSSALFHLQVSIYILVRDFQRVDTITFDR